MKIVLFSFLILFTIAVTAQNIIVKKTDKHVTVDGTSLKMIPPANFEKGQNFYGFQQVKTQSSIVVIQVDKDFTNQTVGFKKETLIKSGYVLKDYKRFKMNDDSAVYISTKQEWGKEVYDKEILAIGNSERTVVINAACLSNHPEMVKVLKEALLSCYIDDEKPKSAIDLMDFTMDPTGTNLEFNDQATRGLNALVYLNKSITGKPLLIATKSLMPIPDDHKTFAKVSVNDLKSLIIPEKTTYFKEIKLDGLSGYESIIEGKDKEGNKATLYRVVVFTTTNYYYAFTGKIQGSESEQENIVRLRKLTQTFKRK